ncbi:Uncharacterized protein GBIM_09358 [Gryllus bimaculatus]|nr:Uncharacterized protein GBIM_09358 [Gryllus bimaculatus]
MRERGVFNDCGECEGTEEQGEQKGRRRWQNNGIGGEGRQKILSFDCAVSKTRVWRKEDFGSGAGEDRQEKGVFDVGNGGDSRIEARMWAKCLGCDSRAVGEMETQVFVVSLRGVLTGDEDGNEVDVEIPLLFHKYRWHERYPDIKIRFMFQVFQRYLTFCGIGIQNAQLFEMSVLEFRRNQILLNLARSIFEEQNNLQCLVTRIMTEARDLLKCERCAVFLLNTDCSEARAATQEAWAPETGHRRPPTSPPAARRPRMRPPPPPCFALRRTTAHRPPPTTRRLPPAQPRQYPAAAAPRLLPAAKPPRPNPPSPKSQPGRPPQPFAARRSADL